MKKSYEKYVVCLLIGLLGLPMTVFGDWLQDMTDNAQQDLKRQGQRAQGGGSHGGGYTPGMGSPFS